MYSLVWHGYGAREVEEVLLSSVIEAELVELGMQAAVVTHRVHEVTLALLGVPVPAPGQQRRHVGLLVVEGHLERLSGTFRRNLRPSPLSLQYLCFDSSAL